VPTPLNMGVSRQHGHPPALPSSFQLFSCQT
jgi:hypothetical protein